jgi:hypothetical protein
MTLESRLTIVEHAIRWSSNILNEVVGNHGRFIPVEAREHLKQATQELSSAAQLLWPLRKTENDPPQ